MLPFPECVWVLFSVAVDSVALCFYYIIILADEGEIEVWRLTTLSQVRVWAAIAVSGHHSALIRRMDGDFYSYDSIGQPHMMLASNLFSNRTHAYSIQRKWASDDDSFNVSYEPQICCRHHIADLVLFIPGISYCFLLCFGQWLCPAFHQYCPLTRMFDNSTASAVCALLPRQNHTHNASYTKVMYEYMMRSHIHISAECSDAHDDGIVSFL